MISDTFYPSTLREVAGADIGHHLRSLKMYFFLQNLICRIAKDCIYVARLAPVKFLDVKPIRPIYLFKCLLRTANTSSIIAAPPATTFVHTVSGCHLFTINCINHSLQSAYSTNSKFGTTKITDFVLSFDGILENIWWSHVEKINLVFTLVTKNLL